jgi:hypothetical protein
MLVVLYARVEPGEPGNSDAVPKVLPSPERKMAAQFGVPDWQVQLEIQKMQFEMRKPELDAEQEKMAADRERDLIAEHEREQVECECEQGEREQGEREREQAEHEREQGEREREHDAERERRRFEHEQKMGALELKPTDGSTSEAMRENKREPIPPKFKEGDDVEAYLRTFERIVTANNWPSNTWAARLTALLTGRARDAYSRMAVEKIGDNSKVRKAILERYELNGEHYRERFRNSYKKLDETYREWYVRLDSYLMHWLDYYKVDDFKKLIDQLLVEQLLNNMPLELSIWLREREPETCEQMTRLADHSDT